MQGKEPKADASSDVGDADDCTDCDDGGDNTKGARLNLSTEATRSKSEQDLGRAHSLELLMVSVDTVSETDAET